MSSVYFKDCTREQARKQLNDYYTSMQHCDDYTQHKKEQRHYYEMLADFNKTFPQEIKKDA